MFAADGFFAEGGPSCGGPGGVVSGDGGCGDHYGWLAEEVVALMGPINAKWVTDGVSGKSYRVGMSPKPSSERGQFAGVALVVGHWSVRLVRHLVVR
jgi:hypothetical protein